MTTIIGVDYSGDQGDHKTWVTCGRLDDSGFTLDRSYPILRTDLCELLAAIEPPAVAALDFPFSLPKVFLKALGINANTMKGVWPHIANMPLGSFKNPNAGTYRARCSNFGTHPKRIGDNHYPVSMSALNTRLVPMTYHGIKMLRKLDREHQHHWWVPPIDQGQSPTDRITLLEVMPGALLSSLGLDFTTVKGYKNAANALATRDMVINRLARHAKETLGMANLLDYRLAFRASDDCLDSVIAAVGAAMWAQNRDRFHHPSDVELLAAQLEGWIYAPKT